MQEKMHMPAVTRPDVVASERDFQLSSYYFSSFLSFRGRNKPWVFGAGLLT